MGTPVRVPSAIQIPELGPALGRLALAMEAGSGPRLGPLLDPIRLDLASNIFELVADARSWSSAGDREAAVDALGRAGWLTAWEEAVRAAAAKVSDQIDGRIEAAAQESRMPRGRLNKLRLNDTEKRTLAARLNRGGFALEEALEPLERESRHFRTAGVLDREAGERWRAALTAAARSLESAWIALEEAADEEWHRWSPLVESIRAWRRPRWLLWLISALVIGAAVYLGLVIGGYLRGPGFLEAVADWWWSWWDRLVEPV